jgi:hypothetical protein
VAARPVFLLPYYQHAFPSTIFIFTSKLLPTPVVLRKLSFVLFVLVNLHLPSFLILLHFKILFGAIFLSLSYIYFLPSFLLRSFYISVPFIFLLSLPVPQDTPSSCCHNTKGYFMLSRALWGFRESDSNLAFSIFKTSSCLFMNRDPQSPHLKHFVFIAVLVLWEFFADL